MINANNYYTKIKSVDLNLLPITLIKSHEFVNTLTKNGASWDSYKNNPSIKNVVDLYFEKLEQFLKSQPQSNSKSNTQIKSSVKKNVKSPSFTKRKVAVKSNKKMDTISKVDAKQNCEEEKKAMQAQLKTKGYAKARPMKKKKVFSKKRIRVKASAIRSNSLKSSKSFNSKRIKLVSHLDDELVFIKRFIALDGKLKTKKQLLGLLESLQKAIVEKRIRKSSIYSDEIRYIQKLLVATINKIPRLYDSFEMQASVSTLKKFEKLVNAEKVDPAIRFIKRYIALQGKRSTKKQILNLAADMKNSVRSGVIKKTHPRSGLLDSIYTQLIKYANMKRPSALKIDQVELRGLMGIVGN
jgi:hypothetical protein